MNKQEAITQVQDCISSVFSKEDVIKLIEQIDSDKIKLQRYLDFLDKIGSQLGRKWESDSHEVIDYESADFSIDYNKRVVLEDICLNVDSMIDDVVSVIQNEFEKLYELEEESVSC
jgi:hypothetical protein